MRGLSTTAGVLLASAMMASAQLSTNWVAFNDHNLNATMPAPMSGANVTFYHLGGLITASGGGPGGTLTNRNTGDQLAATLMVTWTGGDGPDDFGASMDANMGSPAYELFNGIVDIGGAVAGVGGDEGIIGLRNSELNVVTMTFSNLDVSQRYLFRGTSIRGNNYVDRWGVYTLQAASFVDAHVDASANLNLFTADTFPAAGLTGGQVALNSGHNLEGSLVGWNDIEPNADGTITILEQQFVGTAPFGTPSAGPYGYGMNAIMLAEIFSGPPSAPSILTQPAGVTNTEGQVVRLRVLATGTPPLTYQWFSGTAPNGVAIAGATRATLSVTNMAGSDKTWSVPNDSGDYYVVVTGALDPPATSATATVLVHPDTNPPVFLYATCDPVNLNLITLTVSEPLDNSDGRVTDDLNWTIADLTGGGALGAFPVVYTNGTTKIFFTTTIPRDPSHTYQISYGSGGLPLTDLAIAQNVMPPEQSSIVINCIETELLPLNASWRYQDDDVDPGPTWFENSFVDSGWTLSAGVFDAKRDAAGAAGQHCRDMTLYNLGNVGTCINLTSPVTMTNLITAYFRTHFFFGGDPTNAILEANGKFDDGAAIYLNGVELARFGLPPPPFVLSHNYFATRGVGDGDAQDTGRFVFPASLRNGDNLLAVALYQQNLTSSDLTMGLRIVAQTRTPLASLPRMTIAREGTNVRIRWTPANGQLQFTDVLTATPAWQDQTTGQVGPGEYVIPANQMSRFYSLRQ